MKKGDYTIYKNVFFCFCIFLSLLIFIFYFLPIRVIHSSYHGTLYLSVFQSIEPSLYVVLAFSFMSIIVQVIAALLGIAHHENNKLLVINILLLFAMLIINTILYVATFVSSTYIPK